MIDFIKNIEYTVTSDLWKDYRNKGDKYLVEFQYMEDGEKIKTRRTTNKIKRFESYLNSAYPNWLWMNVYFRWADLEKGVFKISQITAYTKFNLPETDNPTKSDLEKFLKFQSKTFGYNRTLAGIEAYQNLVLDRNVD